MGGDVNWRIITDVDSARRTLLKRQSLRDYSVSDEMLQRSERLFGERLSPEESVRRIIGSVRERGDRALIEWNRALDGVDLDDLRVSPDEMYRGAVADRAGIENRAGTRGGSHPAVSSEAATDQLD